MKSEVVAPGLSVLGSHPRTSASAMKTPEATITAVAAAAPRVPKRSAAPSATTV